MQDVRKFPTILLKISWRRCCQTSSSTAAILIIRHSNVITILKNYSLGTSRVNEPMHAVLEGELAESAMVQGKEAQNVRNRALLHYLASLANSNSTEDKFDFDFVESLLKNGADVNSTDKTGQTVFHEVARSWNCDVASFLIKNGKKTLWDHSHP